MLIRREAQIIERKSDVYINAIDAQLKISEKHICNAKAGKQL